MKRIIIISLVCFILLAASGIIYLNNVILPKTAKSLIIKIIEEQTHKNASLGSLRINIFKGLVLRDLALYDGQEQIITVKEASCVFWFWGLMHKKIVIPSITFKSSRLFIEKRKDNNFNLTEIFIPKEDAPAEPKTEAALAADSAKIKPSSGFILEIYRINITDSTVKFKDNSLESPFSLDLNNVDVNIYLSLPNSLKFKASAQLPDNLKPNIHFNGEFKIPQQELKANFIINNIYPDKFAAYYRRLGVVFNDGKLDASGSLALKDNIVDIKCQAKAFNASLKKEKVSLKFNAQANASIKYYPDEGKAKYSGTSLFSDTAIFGLDFVDSIGITRATVSFSDEGLSSEDISANIWNVPVNAKVNLSNYNNPRLNADLITDFDLNYAQGLLKSKFNFELPAQANGSGGLSLNIFTENLNTKQVKLTGSLDIANASLKFDKIEDLIREINGRLEFTTDTLRSKGVNFKYGGLAYKLSLSVDNFHSPKVSLSAASEELSVKSVFAIDKSKVKISDLSGRYLNSDFKASGSFDTVSLGADISGSCLIDLEDLNKPLVKYKEQLDKIKPKGKTEAKFSIKGDIKDIKECDIEAQFSSPVANLYGFKAENLSCYYRQHNGVVGIPFLNFSFYGGQVNISARANLKPDNLPYAVDLLLKDVKIEELKLDTGAKDEDISGIVNGSLKLNGFSNDLSKLSGIGSLAITKGRLWELNLFKGMGKLLFAKDLSNITFHEGSCDFAVADKYISTNNLILKSNIVSLSGNIKIGFDSSIDAVFNIDIMDEFIPLTGTFKDLTTSIIGRSGKFASINITGTLKEPKYRLKPAVENIIRGLADTLKQAIRKNQKAD